MCRCEGVEGAGVEQWLSRFGGSGDDQPNAVTIASDGTIYVAGKAASAFGGANHLGGASDGYLRAIDASGTALSTTRIGGVGNESVCRLFTSPIPRDRTRTRMPSAA